MSYAGRIPSLDGLRGIAAIAVMLFHFNIFFLPQARLPFLGHAYLACDLFFLLSGFVMAHVYGRLLASNWRVHWVRFALARFARIYPLFALTTLAVLIVVALSDTPLKTVSFSLHSLALQPFLLQQWSSGLSWNYPSWSISTEAEAYAFFVFSAGVLVTGKCSHLIAACCVAILVALSTANGGSLDLFLGFPALLRTLSEFSLGVLLYRAHLGDAAFLRNWAAILAILAAALAAITRMDFLIVGAFGCLISYGVNTTDAFGRLLNSRLSIALGDWSYSIYLWHAPTHYAVMATFASSGYPISTLGMSSARLLLLATAFGVVGLSAVSYLYFETPLRRLLSRTTGDFGRAGTVSNA
jgi:peptidoglycan/LPS O-acetylase OafA/YrhL